MLKEKAITQDKISSATQFLIDKLQLKHTAAINTENTISLLAFTRNYEIDTDLAQRIRNGIIDICELSIAIFYLDQVACNRQEFAGVSDELLLKALCKHASTQENILKTSAYDLLFAKPEIAIEKLNTSEVYAEFQKMLVANRVNLLVLALDNEE